MRFDELSIEKYGSFDSLTLALEDHPGLVVLYGANEAGKSTCLAAISDFLYGIPHTSPHGQVFGNEQILLRANLRLASGERRALRRRKGRTGKTLTDESGAAIDESVLAALLGSVSRSQFTSMFGLNHETLREGGKQLLAAEGDIGRLIVEAGGGLRSLLAMVKQLEEEADKLFSTRRAAEREFYRELDRFNAAEKQVREGTITQGDYELARKKHEEAKHELDGLRALEAAKRKQILSDQRLVQVVPLLAELDVIDQRIQAFVDLPSVGVGFAQRARAALLSVERAQQDLAEVEDRYTTLEAQINGLVVPIPLLYAEAQIHDILHKSAQLVRERTSRLKLQKELAELESKLSRLRQSVGAEPDADLTALLPAQSARDRVQQLYAAELALRPKLEAAQQRFVECDEKIAEIKQRRAEHEQAGYDRPFGLSVAELATLPSLTRLFETKSKQASKLDEELTQRLRSSKFASAEALRGFSCPDTAVIQAEIERRSRYEAELLKHSESHKAQVLRRETALAEIARLKQGGEVPTATAIASLRSERDEAWADIREVYLAADPLALSAAPLHQRAAKASVFEGHIRDADHLSDRQSVEAQRITALAVMEKQRDEAVVAITIAEQACSELGNALTQARQQWAETWAEAVAIEPDLGRLKELGEERKRLLDMIQTREDSRLYIEQQEVDISPRLDLLLLAESQMNLKPGPKAGLLARIQSVTQKVTVHEESYRRFCSDGEELASLGTQLDKRRGALDGMREDEAQWSLQWKAAVRKLGLPEEVTPARANEVATQWAEASGILGGIALTRQHLSRIEQDELALKQLLEGLAGQLEMTLPSEPEAAAKLLDTKLKEATTASTKRDTLKPQLASLGSERDRKELARNEAAEKVTACCKEAGCEEAALLQVVERLELLSQTHDLRRQALEKIQSVGDGKSAEWFREQCRGRDIDEIRAGLAQLEDEARGLSEQIEEAAGTLRERANVLAQYRGEQGVNHAVAERERAAAELHRIVERYVELSLARELLSAAIDRLRTEQQNPLIKRAGELFSLATGGAFSGVEADIDEKGGPVVVGRRSGSEQKVTSQLMSEGTRDQLFLAFRLASIEQYCRATEPLPFIADDLLVHFDDARSTASLDLLTELGKTTQVLLFTHHGSVREAAAKIDSRHAVGIVDLGGVCSK